MAFSSPVGQATPAPNKGTVNGKTQVVAVHFHRGSDDIKRKTLQSMIRQSGLPKDLFR